MAEGYSYREVRAILGLDLDELGELIVAGILEPVEDRFSIEAIDQLRSRRTRARAAAESETSILARLPRVRVELLLQSIDKLSQLLERDRLLRDGILLACDLAVCKKGSITLKEQDGELWLASVHGMSREVWSSIDKDKLGGRLAQRVIRSGRSLQFNDVRELGLEPEERYETNAALVVPIIDPRSGLARGALSTTDRADGRVPDAIDCFLLESFAKQLGTCLANAEAFERSKLDSMTQVFMGRVFLDRLGRDIDHARQRGRPLGLLVIGIDRLDAIDAELGLGAGDSVLRAAAATIKRCIQPSEFLARTADGEYSVILTRTDAARIERVGERIRQALAETEAPAKAEASLTISASVGAVLFSPELDRKSFLSLGRRALNSAKESGGNRLALMTPPGHLGV